MSKESFIFITAILSPDMNDIQGCYAVGMRSHSRIPILSRFDVNHFSKYLNIRAYPWFYRRK